MTARTLAVLCLLGFLTACGPAADPEPVEETPDDLELLTTWMTGSFSSGPQAESDPEYHDIRLEMVPIWTGRDDGPWLYVEQAAATALDKPYRQRIYHVTRIEDGGYSSAVYEFPEPLTYAGAFRDPSAFAALTPDDLTVREGCAVYLVREDQGPFAGSTREQECISALRGASYATSNVRITAHGIASWDRGFDADGNQVWGAEAGPYIFRRMDGGESTED